ncbi:hypothetical protein B9Z55_020513 [Caenorhabditis nigoni]|uniref:Uncharacterized protein n=1 Tax=Caenorhabditis nigoni TaxID=1611254 RepID=A0A2G5TN10_9PELO|nr:hypothetical protein B9Z55_020513 [Caenorhabditis nigoni]
MQSFFTYGRSQATMLERESTKSANQGDAKEIGHKLPWMVRIPVQVNVEAPSYLDEHERPAGVRGIGGPGLHDQPPHSTTSQLRTSIKDEAVPSATHCPSSGLHKTKKHQSGVL